MICRHASTLPQFCGLIFHASFFHACPSSTLLFGLVWKEPWKRKMAKNRAFSPYSTLSTLLSKKRKKERKRGDTAVLAKSFRGSVEGVAKVETHA